MEEKEVLTEFMKNRMVGYAELLKDVAKVYLPGKDEEGPAVSRAELFARKKVNEQREIFSDFVMDASKHLENIAEAPFAGTSLAKKQEMKVRKELLNAGILTKEYYRGENRNGYTEIGMVVKSKDKSYFEVEDIAQLLSDITHLSMLPSSEGSTAYVHNEWVALCFEEETRFQIYGGYAKVTKEGEEISGDNYLMREFGDGTYIAAIADGMGSGEKACHDSENVLALVEKHMESGLSVRSCIRACDELLYVQYLGERSVSLDLMELNLYTGECNLHKNGSASSFLIRKGKATEISADRLSLGINPRIKGYRETLFLQSQDIILLSSDGVMDLFYDNMELFESYVAGLAGMSLQDLAANILQMAIRAGGGSIRDDMTILAVGLCEKEVEPVAF